MNNNYSEIIEFIKDLYNKSDFISLHEPIFCGNEKKYTNECIDSTFVSTFGGDYTKKVEDFISKYVSSRFAITTVNGTSALHIALLLSGIEEGEEVITQAFTFVATINAISYCKSRPVFIDIDKNTLGMSPEKLEDFIRNHTYKDKNGNLYNKITKNKIKACLPVHLYGHPCNMQKIKEICLENNLFLIEDSAEALGSKQNNKSTGTFGDVGIYSFNGNKIVTCGGGGIIITDNEKLSRKAKHLVTTGKIVDSSNNYSYHDMVAYNYRMPNINASLLLAQLENIDLFIRSKKIISEKYDSFLSEYDILEYFRVKENYESNYWLNTIFFKTKKDRDDFLKETNFNGVMTRPTWPLVCNFDMYKDFLKIDLENSIWASEHGVNVPSSVIL